MGDGPAVRVVVRRGGASLGVRPRTWADTYAADGVPSRPKVRRADTYGADGVPSRPKVRRADTYAADGVPSRPKVRRADTYGADGVPSRPKVRRADTYAADGVLCAMDNEDNSGATSGGAVRCSAAPSRSCPPLPTAPTTPTTTTRRREGQGLAQPLKVHAAVTADVSLCPPHLPSAPSLSRRRRACGVVGRCSGDPAQPTDLARTCPCLHGPPGHPMPPDPHVLRPAPDRPTRQPNPMSCPRVRTDPKPDPSPHG